MVDLMHLPNSLAVVADAEQPIGPIELLSVAERTYLLEAEPDGGDVS
ncbi:hypothetical protein J4G48_0048960 (plasmid) [Bradyrhizobium barranii subsp. apii]|nr:hypothetical protein [Bradyrhizobium barranii]UPU01365.1 hypothetical protein J4G48_0048960 [Bradyrhizobium barranii subsp. apii]